MKRSGEWIPFGPKKYIRSIAVYENLDFGFDFSELKLSAVAPFGGPIAFIQRNAVTVVTVTNAAGRRLWDAELPTDGGEADAIGWTHEEALVVITSKPACLVWVANRQSFHSIKLPRFQKGPSVQYSTVRPVCSIIVGLGSVLTVKFPEKKEPIVTETDIPLSAVNCADVLPAALSENDLDRVFIAGTMTNPKTKKSVNSIVTFTVGDAVEDCGVNFPSAIERLVVAPNGINILVALASGVILICPTDLSTTTKRIDTAVGKCPIDVQWCGSLFVHLQYNVNQFSEDSFETGHISVILPALEASNNKEVRKWDLEGSGLILTVTEIDGLRIISENTNYFFEIVPQCLIDIHALGSKSKAAQLSQAASQASSGTIEGITALRLLTENATELYDVLDSVVAAAASEFSQTAQEDLLSVVAVTTSHGRVKYDSDAYVDVCKRIRFFNNIRSSRHCAVPISHAQYLALSGSSELRQIQPREAQVVVDRLVQRGDFQWAINVANFLGMKIDKVLVQWSVFRVISATNEAAAHAEILNTLRQCPGAGFTEAALEAAALGKQRLAVQLLDSEPRSQAQVLLLLQMGLDEIAMEKAVASHDADLTYLVLLKLRHFMADANFFAALNRFEVARMQFLAASKYSPTLSEIATRYLTDARSERHVAAVLVANAFEGDTGSEENPAVDDDVAPGKIAGTQRVSGELMEKLESLYGASESTKDEARLCAVHRSLLTEQDAIMAEKGDPEIYNTSVMDTVKYCIRNGMDERAESLRKQFEVPDKKFWFAKLQALCDSAQWDAVERLGGIGRYKPVKSPIGFAPFVETLYEKNQPEKAAAFVPKLTTVVQRVEWFVKLDEFQMAVDEAFKDENVNLLQQIRKRAHNPSILHYIDEHIKELQ